MKIIGLKYQIAKVPALSTQSRFICCTHAAKHEGANHYCANKTKVGIWSGALEECNNIRLKVYSFFLVHSDE